MLNHVQGQVWKRVWIFEARSENGCGKWQFFGLKLGLDLEMRTAHPHKKFQGVPPRGLERLLTHVIRCLGYQIYWQVYRCRLLHNSHGSEYSEAAVQVETLSESLIRSKHRLDHQPLFGKGVRAPPPSRGGTQTRHERAAEIEPQ